MMIRSIAFLLLMLLMLGCNRETSASKSYAIQGKVVAVDSAKKKITLDHQEIPGYMQAMEMPFDVANANVVNGIQAGDAVQGKLQVKDGHATITELKKR